MSRLTTRQFAKALNLKVRQARNILGNAYHSQKPWKYLGERYALDVKKDPKTLGFTVDAARVREITSKPVTPHISLNPIEKDKPAPKRTPFFGTGELTHFCDWLQIKQKHPSVEVIDDQLIELDIADFYDGEIVRTKGHALKSVPVADDLTPAEISKPSNNILYGTTEDGVQTSTKLGVMHEGSFSTVVRIRCVDNEVQFSGNPSAFNRMDNVWGYDFFDCLEIANNIVTSQGLPPFTAGREAEHDVKRKGRDGRYETVLETTWTGAVVQRIDLTVNIAMGSLSTAYDYMSHLAHQKPFRTDNDVPYRDPAGNINTLSWGGNGSFIYRKVYIKSHELREHKLKSLQKNLTKLRREKTPDLTKINNTLKQIQYINDELIPYCEQNGLMRLEISLKNRMLRERKLRYLGDIMNELKNRKQRSVVFTDILEETTDRLFCHADLVDTSVLPNAAHKTVTRWFNKENIRHSMSKATFYRHKKQILDMLNIDISKPYTGNTKKYDISQIQTHVPVQMKQLDKPDWYDLPEVSFN
jgi:II/X family phage/plasmid replication protein